MKKTCPFNINPSSIRLLWEITNKCNLKCKHCLFFESDNCVSKDELTYEEACSIIDNIANDGRVKEIWISGGEPLLYKNLLPIVKYIVSKKICPSISTNAYLVTDELAKELYLAGIRYVHVSIDGIDAKTHDSLRQVKGSFIRAVNGIKHLNTVGIMTGASFIVTEDSVDQVWDMLAFAQSINLSVLSFYLVEPLGRATSNTFGNRNILQSKLRNIKQKIEKNDSIFKGKIDFQRLTVDDDDILEECHGDCFLTITPDGGLGVCPWLMKSKLKYIGANLLTDDFNVGVMNCRQYIKTLKENRKQQGSCKNCQDNNRCGQGCPATGLISNLTPYGFDVLCTRGLHNGVL